LESSGSQLSHGIFEKIFCDSCKVSEFCGRIWTDIFTYIETLSYALYNI
jgi:hypothetical protein